MVGTVAAEGQSAQGSHVDDVTGHHSADLLGLGPPVERLIVCIN